MTLDIAVRTPDGRPAKGDFSIAVTDRSAIPLRTAGDIYIGVVGPVRAGKSTFIKRFMETQVIPNIDNVYRRERAKDELPQSGSGRKEQPKSKAAIRSCTHSFAQRVQYHFRRG